jgi:hypothetical protein
VGRVDTLIQNTLIVAKLQQPINDTLILTFLGIIWASFKYSSVSKVKRMDAVDWARYPSLCHMAVAFRPS